MNPGLPRAIKVLVITLVLIASTTRTLGTIFELLPLVTFSKNSCAVLAESLARCMISPCPDLSCNETIPLSSENDTSTNIRSSSPVIASRCIETNQHQAVALKKKPLHQDTIRSSSPIIASRCTENIQHQDSEQDQQCTQGRRKERAKAARKADEKQPDSSASAGTFQLILLFFLV